MHQRGSSVGRIGRLLTNRTGYRRKADVTLHPVYGPEWDKAPAQVRLTPDDIDLPVGLVAAGMTPDQEERTVSYIKHIVAYHPFFGRLAKEVADGCARHYLQQFNELYVYFRKVGESSRHAWSKAMRRL